MYVTDYETNQDVLYTGKKIHMHCKEHAMNAKVLQKYTYIFLCNGIVVKDGQSKEKKKER